MAQMRSKLMMPMMKPLSKVNKWTMPTVKSLPRNKGVPFPCGAMCHSAPYSYSLRCPFRYSNTAYSSDGQNNHGNDNNDRSNTIRSFRENAFVRSGTQESQHVTPQNGTWSTFGTVLILGTSDVIGFDSIRPHPRANMPRRGKTSKCVCTPYS